MQIKMDAIAEGRTEGFAEGKLEIARKMKAFGDTVEKIHAVTDIPVETIELI